MILPGEGFNSIARFIFNTTMQPHRRANLRDGGGGVNGRNRRAYANNTSGVTGASRASRQPGWTATSSRYFSDSNFGGRVGALRAACLWRAEKAAEVDNTNGQ